ncbi:MAG: hypothetical protein ACHQ2F_03125 [Desulfobaccales bacterium]
MYHYEVISDEIIFEEFIRDLFNVDHNTQSFQLYKSKGGVQHGIDVFSTEKRIVIQCKKKDTSRPDKTLRAELMDDLSISLQLIELLPFDFDVFILASTTKKYGEVQDHAAKISQQKPFDIQFLSWKDIEKLIHRYINIREKYYPHLFSHKIPSPQFFNISQHINHSNIYGNVRQIAEHKNYHYTTIKPPDIKILPPIGSIGANPLLKQAIKSKFDKLGEEREKRFGKNAYRVMYNNFKRDFGIEGKWTVIWEWPEACADEILKYLVEKNYNTMAGRVEKAATKPGYVHKRPYLYKREKELLAQIGVEISSEEVKGYLYRYFGVISHKNLTNLQHWQWVCYLEKEVEKMYK